MKFSLPKEQNMKLITSFLLCAALGAAITTVSAQDADLASADSSNFKDKYPFQYERWTASKADTVTGDMIEAYPALAILRAGTGGPAGPRLLKLRGHYYSYLDFATMQDSGIPSGGKNDNTSARCLVCHSTLSAAIQDKDGEKVLLSSKWSKYGKDGFHPVGCINCHDPKTMQLRVQPTWLNKMLVKAGKPVFEKAGNDRFSLICAQCHYEGYTKTDTEALPDNPNAKVINSFTAWKNGLDLASQEAYLNDGKNFENNKPHVDLIHPLSKAPIIWSIHPDFEVFKTGVHGKNGVQCTSCHMPKVTEKGIKLTDHKIGNPLNNVQSTCGQCHGTKAETMAAIVKERKQRAETLRVNSMNNLAAAHLEAKKAWEVGASQEEMKPVLAEIRSSYWYWNSLARAAYMHNPDETFAGFARANDSAQKARLLLKDILVKHGVTNYQVPEFDTKEKALALLDLPQRDTFIKEKCNSIEKDFAEWRKTPGFKEPQMPANIESWYERECKK
jgi:nitrite reductase (cytochrome c-552)